jgi:hypothetical protein
MILRFNVRMLTLLAVLVVVAIVSIAYRSGEAPPARRATSTRCAFVGARLCAPRLTPHHVAPGRAVQHYPLARSIPESRSKACDRLVYPPSLPKAAVIICFRNESVLMLVRTCPMNGHSHAPRDVDVARGTRTYVHTHRGGRCTRCWSAQMTTC